MKRARFLSLCLIACGNVVPSEVSFPPVTDGGPVSQSVNGILCFSPVPGDPPVVAKSFIIAQPPVEACSTAESDNCPDWTLRERVVNATPDIFALKGVEWTGRVRFETTMDELNVLKFLPSSPRQPEMYTWRGLVHWSGTNVDVGSGCATIEDGHWETRGWVLLDLHKDNVDDLAAFDAPPYAFPKCILRPLSGQSALVPGTFVIDPAGTIAWHESITANIACPGVDATELALDVEFLFTRS